MKGSKIIAFVALLAVLAGIVGVIVCVLPSQSAPDKAISAYVSAINAVKVEKMNKYTFASVASDALGNLFGGQLDDLVNSGEATPVNGIYGALQKSTFSVSGLPDDLTKVTSVKLIGCVDGETETYLGMTGLNVTAILQISYEDSNGEAQTLNTTENIGLILYKNKYYIAS